MSWLWFLAIVELVLARVPPSAQRRFRDDEVVRRLGLQTADGKG